VDGARGSEAGHVDDPRDEEFFGDDATDDSPLTQPGEPGQPAQPAQPEGDKSLDDLLLGEGAGQESAELTGSLLSELTTEKLQMGGMVYLRLSASQAQEERGPVLASPNLLDLFLDARPNDRTRAYARGRLVYTPLSSTMVPGVTPEAEETRALLDQLFIHFDVGRWMFLTVGKQPVRWGTSRLWNPVDGINASKKDPLAFFDERTGVPMIKAHLPIEPLGLNAIGLLMLQGDGRWDELGAALRLEKPVGTAEVGLSGVLTERSDPLTLPQLLAGTSADRHREYQLGLDLSAGVWDLDLTAEAALTFLEDEGSLRRELFRANGWDALVQATLGASYTLKYDASEYIVFGAEYFYNRNGLEHKSDYLESIATGSASPFYLGRHYAALYILLPMPGNWNNTSFTLSNISNLSDGSGLTRFDMRTDILTWVKLEAYLSGNWGTKGGEFRFGLEEIPFVPDSSLPYPLLQGGVNLRMDL